AMGGHKAQTRANLHAAIERASGLISDAPVIYFDTVAVLLPTMMPARALAEIRKHCGHIEQKPSKAWLSGFRFRVTLHQPEAEALRLISENFYHIVSEFHVAYDLPARTPANAAALTSLVQHLRFQPWHGNRQSNWVEKTSYASTERRTARNIRIYG